MTVLGRVLLVTSSLLAFSALCVSAWLHGPRGQAYLQRAVVGEAQKVITGRLRVERVSGWLLSRARLDGVEIRDETGRLVARSPRVTLRYHVWDLLFGRVGRVRRIDVSQPLVHVFRRPDGRVDVDALFRKGGGGAEGGGVSIGAIVVYDGRLVVEGARGGTLDGVDARGSVRVTPAAVDVTVRSGRGSVAWFGARRPFVASGRIHFDRDALRFDGLAAHVGGSDVAGDAHFALRGPWVARPFSLDLRRGDIAPAELRVFLPWLAPRVRPSITGRADGTLGEGAIAAVVSLPRGRAHLVSTISLPPPGRELLRISSARITLEGVDLDQLLHDTPVHVTGTVELSGVVRRGSAGSGLAGQATTRDAHGDYRGVPFSSLEGRVQLARRVARLPAFQLYVPGARVQGRGQADLDGGVHLAFEVRVLDPDRLPDLSGWKKALVHLSSPLVRLVPLRGTVERAPDQPASVKIEPQLPGAGAMHDLGGAIKSIPRKLGL